MPKRHFWLRLKGRQDACCGEEPSKPGTRCELVCFANHVCFVVLHLGMAEEEAGRDSEASPPLERSKSAFYKKEGTCDEDLLASLTLTPSCQMTLTASAITSHFSPSPKPLKKTHVEVVDFVFQVTRKSAPH